MFVCVSLYMCHLFFQCKILLFQTGSRSRRQDIEFLIRFEMNLYFIVIITLVNLKQQESNVYSRLF